MEVVAPASAVLRTVLTGTLAVRWRWGILASQVLSWYQSLVGVACIDGLACMYSEMGWTEVEPRPAGGLGAHLDLAAPQDGRGCLLGGRYTARRGQAV